MIVTVKKNNAKNNCKIELLINRSVIEEVNNLIGSNLKKIQNEKDIVKKKQIVFSIFFEKI
tara:strand:- start:603 stop:785 length:183 start_codon:yes stop_codon:yes gene_type:complete